MLEGIFNILSLPIEDMALKLLLSAIVAMVIIYFVRKKLNVKKIKIGNNVIEMGDDENKDSGENKNPPDKKELGIFITDENIINYVAYGLKRHISILSNIQQKIYCEIEFEYFNKVISKMHDITPEMEKNIAFKKRVASVFLQKCMFPFLSDSIQNWIETIEKEFDNTDKDKRNNLDYIPKSVYLLTNTFNIFYNEIRERCATVEYTFDGKKIVGIPKKYTDTYISLISKRSDKIIDLINDATSIRVPIIWCTRVKSILDYIDIYMDTLILGVDSLLCSLNGDLELYIKKIENSTIQPIDLNYLD